MQFEAFLQFARRDFESILTYLMNISDIHLADTVCETVSVVKAMETPERCLSMPRLFDEPIAKVFKSL